MKITTFLSLCCLVNLFAAPTYSQSTKISLKLADATIEDVLNKIEDLSDFYFLYNNKLIDVTRKISVAEDKESIRNILNDILDKRTRFIVYDRQIILTPSDVESFSMVMQQLKITGTVTEKDGTPLPGVTVVVTGTTQGTVTDVAGAYSIEVPPGSKSLTFSFIGMESQEVAIGPSTEINVTMSESTLTLDEVVVVGYGVQKKKLVTGSSVEVDGNDIEKRSAVSLLTALQGQTPGVNITSVGGQPGSGFRVSIRGAGTVGETTPLYVVDGVQTSDISFLNTADIASVDVLKDAASAAIYGSRAANGVILITTKKGTVGEAQVSFDGYFGFQNASKKLDVLNGRDYIDMMNEMATNSGSAPVYPDEAQNEQILKNVNGGTDWLGLILANNVPTQNYNLRAQGGTERSIYALSLSYTQQGGIVGGTDLSNYKRYTFRLNTEHKLYKDVLKVGEDLSYSNSSTIGGSYPISGAIRMLPVIPNMDPNDPSTFYYNNSPSAGGDNDLGLWSTEITNPYANMLYNNNILGNTNKVIGDVYFDLKVAKNLKFRTTLSIDYTASRNRSYSPLYPNLSISANADTRVTQVSQSFNERLSKTIDNILQYSANINDVHEFDAMVGMSALKTNEEYLSASNKNLLYEGMDYAWLDNATGTSQAGTMSMSSYPSEDALLSYFGRLSYNYKGTLMATAILRSDGSSRFDKAYRRGYFPSLSAGWNISNESFMRSSDPWLSSLKLRASWGQNGNMNIPPYYYMALVRANLPYSFGDDGNSEVGASIYRGGNATLAWEKSQSTNIGFDSRLFNDKLGFTFDWYNKQTKDWLIRSNVPLVNGVEAPYINGGNVTNQGVELALDYSNEIGSDFTYTIAGNIAFNKSTVGSIPTVGGILHGGTGTLYANSSEVTRTQNGYPLGYFWGQTTDGIFQTQEEIDSYKNKDGVAIQPNAKPGDIRYVDSNGDGLINENDKTVIGDGHPKAIFGLTFSFNYKNFDLSIVANGVAGNKILQNYVDANRNYWNYTQDLYDQRWHGPGTSDRYPRFDLQNYNWIQFSDIFLYDGDYLKINNITLGYDFAKIVKSLNQLRLYVSVQNLYNFTAYNGMDPEIGTGNNGVDQSEIGRDSGMYPHARTILLGVNVKF